MIRASPFSDKPNARYGSREFHSIMMGAAALGVSVFGYTSAVRKWKTASQKLEKGHREVPCGEWMCNICQRIDPETLIQAFEEKISFQVKKMQFHGLLRGKTVDIALDLHLIRHWNKKHGADPCALKEQGADRPLREVRHGAGRRAGAGSWPWEDSTCRRSRTRQTTCEGS